MDNHIKLFKTHEEYLEFLSKECGIFWTAPDGVTHKYVRQEGDDYTDDDGKKWYGYSKIDIIGYDFDFIYLDTIIDEKKDGDYETTLNYGGETSRVTMTVVSGDSYVEHHVSLCRNEVPADGRKYCMQYDKTGVMVINIGAQTPFDTMEDAGIMVLYTATSPESSHSEFVKVCELKFGEVAHITIPENRTLYSAQANTIIVNDGEEGMGCGRSEPGYNPSGLNMFYDIPDGATKLSLARFPL